MTSARRGSFSASVTQRVVEGAHLHGSIRAGSRQHLEIHHRRLIHQLHVPATLRGRASARGVNENPSDDGCGHGQEVRRDPASRPSAHPPDARTLGAPARSHPLARPLLADVYCGQSFRNWSYDEWCQALERLVVAAPPGLERRRNLGRRQGCQHESRSCRIERSRATLILRFPSGARKRRKVGRRCSCWSGFSLRAKRSPGEPPERS